MPYIAFDLDALNSAPDVAAHAGIEDNDAVAGLVKMWAYCFRRKTHHVGAELLAGWFRGDGARVATALIAFNFLEDTGTQFRVRGAERYLRISDAQRRGGLAAKGNLKRGKTPPAGSRLVPGSLPASPPAPAGEQPESSRRSSPALTPSTEHHIKNPLAGNGANTPRVEVPAPLPRRATERVSEVTHPTPATCDPADLREGVEAAFLRHTGRAMDWGFPGSTQERALRAMAALGPLATVLELVDVAFNPNGLTYTLEQIPSQRNAIAQKAAKLRARATAATGPPAKGRASNADKDWSNPQPTVTTANGEEWDLGI